MCGACDFDCDCRCCRNPDLYCSVCDFDDAHYVFTGHDE